MAVAYHFNPFQKPPAPTEALRTPTASSSLTCSSAPDSLAQEPDADSATAAIADDDASCKTDAPTSSSRTSRRLVLFAVFFETAHSKRRSEGVFSFGVDRIEAEDARERRFSRVS